MAPGVKGPGTTVYVAAHNLIKAHAKAYHVYDEEFRPTQKGMARFFLYYLVYIFVSLMLLKLLNQSMHIY